MELANRLLLCLRSFAKAIPRQFRRTFQYTYFLRFSLFVWAFPLLFALLDMKKSFTLTRGIFVPERWQGYTCVVFFLVCKGFVALISSRTVVVNGLERYNTVPPRWMTKMLANDQGSCELWPVALSQVPPLLMFVYLAAVGMTEGVSLYVILKGFWWGFFAALLFCYGINAWYYLAYECPPKYSSLPTLALGKNAARTILFPRWAFRLRPVGSVFPPPENEATLENIVTFLRGNQLARLSRTIWMRLGRFLPGFSHQGRVYEAHIFAFIAVTAFTVLFWVLYPLTSPVPDWWARVSFVVLGISLVAMWTVFLSGTGGSKTVRRVWKGVLCTLSAVFCAVVPWVYSGLGGERFPILASVLLLVIVVGWLLSGFAFLLDRYRIPVLTLFLLAIFLPRLLWSAYSRNEEHFVSTTDQASVPDGKPAVPTPAEILMQRLQRDRQRPLIIVTATGGGLHAGAWMARVMEQIDRELGQYDLSEKRNANLNPNAAEDFRSHILLMSTVSGGSVGLSYYLRELDPAANGGRANFKRMVVSAQCSSLEAVGWGLVYYDLRKALLPRGPFTSPSSGDGDLETSPLDKDRTWALRKGMERNVYDEYCKETADAQEADAAVMPSVVHTTTRSLLDRLWPDRWVDPWKQQTLSSLNALAPPESYHSLPRGPVSPPFPAFTMNTTTAEAGERLLLANYRIPDYRIGPVEGAPAESFLDLYRTGVRPDLPIPAAAQLSATFPFVSSAARIPMRYGDHKSEHFVDGGYYDNDGTASVIEFLRYALTVPKNSENGTPVDELCNKKNVLRDQKEIDLCQARDLNELLGPGWSGVKTEPAGPCPAHAEPDDGGKMHVILIEIRNSKDQDSPRDAFPRRATEGGSAVPEGLLSQLSDPLSGFWEAGHDSNTSRNRNGLDLAISALCSKLVIHHIIVDDETAPSPKWGIRSADDPLSWSLTPRERRQLREASDAWNGLGPCYVEVVNAFVNFTEATLKHPLPVRCTGRSPGDEGNQTAWQEWTRNHAAWAAAMPLPVRPQAPAPHSTQ